MDIYEYFKPLRNYLKSFELADSFYVIWAYNQNIAYNKPFPKDIIPLPNFSQQDYVQKVRLVAPWQLEILAKEIIIHADPLQFPKKTFRNPNYLSNAIKKLHDFEGAIGKKYTNKDNILKEMQRLSHRQFPWQTMNPNTPTFARYYKIFSNLEINTIINKTIGLSINEMYLIGVLFWGLCQDHPAIDRPIKSEVIEITVDKINKFLDFFSISTEKIKPVLQSEQKLDEKYQYAFNTLRKFPLLDTKNGMKRSMFCPFPSLLFQQILSGIYYSIYDKSGFDNAFGNAFQEYIGEVIKSAHLNENIKIYKEQLYGISKERTSDWIIEDSDSLLFVECKTKRLTYEAKSELITDEKMDEQLDIMAEAIAQIYKTIKDYQGNLYPSLKFIPNKSIFPLVITLEDWYFFGEQTSLKRKVSEKLINEQVPVDLIEKMPYSICSSQEFELIIQILQSVSIKDFFLKKLLDREMSTWLYASYLKNEFKDIKTNNLFPNELDKILPESLKSKFDKNSMLDSKISQSEKGDRFHLRPVR